MFNSISTDKWLVAFAFSLISLIGGSLGYVMRTMDAGGKVRAVMVVLEGFSAAFFGFIMYAIYSELNIKLGFAFGMAGILAWAGARATLKMLMQIVALRTGIKFNSEDSRNDDNTK